MKSGPYASVLMMLMLLLALGAASFAFDALAQQPTQPEATDEPVKTEPAGGDDEDSAQTIEDDPTIAPDEESSADNNITFPIDI
jgi:hypothetical protein